MHAKGIALPVLETLLASNKNELAMIVTLCSAIASLYPNSVASILTLWSMWTTPRLTGSNCQCWTAFTSHEDQDGLLGYTGQ